MIKSNSFLSRSWNEQTFENDTDLMLCGVLWFCRYDTGKDGFIDLMELKLMMEKLGAPQTHLGLKNMIKEVDEDFDGKLSFREVSVTSLGCGVLLLSLLTMLKMGSYISR